MQKYELIFILKAEAPDGEMQSRVDRVKQILAQPNSERQLYNLNIPSSALDSQAEEDSTRRRCRLEAGNTC